MDFWDRIILFALIAAVLTPVRSVPLADDAD